MRKAAAFFAFGVAVHNADHLRRGTGSVSTELFWAGTAALVLSLTAIGLALAGHRRAPVAALAGIPLAAGFAAAHLLPTWSVLSDSFVDGDVALVSWVAVLLEIAGALTLAAAGVVALRRVRRRPELVPQTPN